MHVPFLFSTPTPISPVCKVNTGRSFSLLRAGDFGNIYTIPPFPECVCGPGGGGVGEGGWWRLFVPQHAPPQVYHAPNPIGFARSLPLGIVSSIPSRSLYYSFSGIPHVWPSRRQFFRFGPCLVAFLSPYLSPLSQKLHTSYKLLWIVREKLFRLNRRNTCVIARTSLWHDYMSSLYLKSFW